MGVGGAHTRDKLLWGRYLKFIAVSTSALKTAKYTVGQVLIASLWDVLALPAL